MEITSNLNITKHELAKAILRSRGSSFAELAREIGVNRTQITACLKGRLKSARIEKAIANALGEPVESVFPDHQSKAA